MSNPVGSANITFNCEHCDKRLSVPATKVAARFICPGCKATVSVPAAQVEAIAESQIETVEMQPVAAEELRPPAVDAPAAVEVTPAAPRRRPNYRAAPESKPKSNRTTVMIVAGAVAAAVLIAAGVFISNGMERRKIEGNITQLLSQADAKFKQNDVTGAAADAGAAQAAITASAQPLDEELKKQWDAQIKRVDAMKEQLAQLDAIMAGASKDLAATRDRLHDRQLALGKATDDNRPAALKLETLLAEIARLELKAKVQRIESALEEANKFYRDGKIVVAAEKGDQLVRDMQITPIVQNAEIEGRVKILKTYAETFKGAENAQRKASTGKFADAIKDISRQLGQLESSKDDVKPLADSLNALIARVKAQERAASRRLAPEELKDLKSMAGIMGRIDPGIAPQSAEGGDTVGMSVNGNNVRLGVYHSDKDANPLPDKSLPQKNLCVEAGGFRFLVSAQQVLPRGAFPNDFASRDNTESQRFRTTRVLLHAYNLGEAMKKAAVPPDTLWDASSQAPLVSARRVENGKEYVFLGDRVYAGKPEEKSEERDRLKADFDKKSEALEQAVLNDKPTPQETREMIAEAVHAAYHEADWADHLPGEFVRKVIADNYIERNMPGSAQRLKAELANWRDAYAAISKPTFNFSGTDEQGDSATEYKTIENHPVWRIYDHAADTTTFAINNPDEEKDCLFILYDFPGDVANFPDNATPKRVSMTHQATGVTASYDPAGGKMSYDKDKWDLAAVLETPPMPAEYRTSKGLGDPSWALPPHVLLVDYNRDTQGIVTPTGRLNMKDFRKVPEADRKAEMGKFLDQMAIVMPTNNYLHLYFRYFHEYLLDSPVTSNLELMGSRTHSGNKQQTTYQSLMRMMGGRFTGDCGDLAELYMDVSRRNNKLSYVMALPMHAACGWAEKKPGDNEYTFYMCDTGPPRIFHDKELDKVIEKAESAYDEKKTLRIDPKELGFLFRFNNEPTRTPYSLSSRMFLDKEYGEAMERVQSYWHFHFYKLGIETMTAMINKGDRVPENCIELAGLYGWVREADDSLHWTNEAIKQFGPEEKTSRLDEEFRIGSLWHAEHEKQKAFDAVKGAVKELIDLHKSPDTMNYISARFEFMNLLIALDKPWEAWELIKPEMLLFANRGMLRIDHVGGLTSMYKKMKLAAAGGKELSADERANMELVDKLLTWFYTGPVFQKDDDFVEILRKYAYLGLWYSCKEGQEKYVAELLKDGPFPDPKTPRDHTNRKNSEDEDWKWIRLSMNSYELAVGEAMSFDDPPEKWRKDEAVKLANAMTRASEHTRQYGSLGQDEYGLFSTEVLRDFMAKDWKDLEQVVQETGKRDWARLTMAVTDAIGRGARFVTPEEFAQQSRMIFKYIHSRPAYFAVVTEAYKMDGIEQAVAAAKVAVECNAGDEDMKREAAFIAELAKKKSARGKAADAQKPDDKAPAKNGVN